MIITDRQRMALAEGYNHFCDIQESSSLPFPYGLPGWKCLSDVGALSEKLCRLNHIDMYKPRPREKGSDLWYLMLMKLNHARDEEEQMLSLIRMAPALSRLAEQEMIS